MKIFKLITSITLGLLVIALILGNIFYLQVRRFVDRNYIALELADTELNRLNDSGFKNADYSLKIHSDKSVYNKFEKIKLFARLVRKSDQTIPENSVIEVSFSQSGNTIHNLNGNEKIKLIYNKDQKAWIGYFYPDSSSITGIIDVEAYGSVDSPEAPISAKNSFYIKDLTPKYNLRKGLAFVGIDSEERISKRNILSTESKEVDWNYIPEWINFISADGIMMLSGITKTFQDDISLDSPWDKDKISETQILADRIKQRGKSFGTWLKCLKVEGIYAKKIGYRPVLKLEADKISEDSSFISLLDENRKKSIIRQMTAFMDSDSYTYAGLSDLQMSGNQGLELLEEFFKEFQISIPSNWETMDANSKVELFQGKMKDTGLLAQFIAWKKFKLADYIREVIEKSGHKKALFYYADYSEILENPELVTLILNAGLDFLVINFNIAYDSLDSVLDKMSQLQGLSSIFNRVIISYYIDYKNMDYDGFDQSAIENYVNANLSIVKFGSEYLNANGIMINDLYKAMFGKRGPYSPYEWMLGIGDTIYRFKKMNKNLPITFDFTVPKVISYGKEFQVLMDVVNINSKPVANFKVDFLPVNGIGVQKSTVINEIQGGKEVVMSLPLTLETNLSQFVRKKNFIGLRVSWAESTKDASGSRSGFVLFKSIVIGQDNGTNLKPAAAK